MKTKQHPQHPEVYWEDYTSNRRRRSQFFSSKKERRERAVILREQGYVVKLRDLHFNGETEPSFLLEAEKPIVSE